MPSSPLSNFAIAAATFALPVVTGPASAVAAPISTYSASGANAAAIQAAVGDFQAALGTLNPNNPGSVGSGRREINWDGVPDAASVPFAGNFFNANAVGRARGAEFTTAGTGFEVSLATAGPVRFGDINPAYSGLFQTFSAPKLFTGVGSNVVDVTFFVPGSNTAALTRGFGSVFTDVDLANVTSLAFYDAGNTLLDLIHVPAAQGNGTLSFLGADYGSAVVSRVRITSGNSALGPNEIDGRDLVVMDDFIYGEPVAAAIPEPGSLALLAAGVLGLGLGRRRARTA